MQIVLFCNNAGQQAGQPKKSSNTLNLTLPPRSDKVDDANADFFADPNNKGANLTLNGVSDYVLEAFRGNPRVKVTLEVLAD